MFKKKLAEYNKPMFLSVLGSIFSFAVGLINPIFGAILIKIVFIMLGLTPATYPDAISLVSKWVYILAGCTGYIFLMVACRGIFFGIVSENITENMRRDVYTSVLRKHMGWHDIRTNNAGMITAVLAGECSSL